MSTENILGGASKYVSLEFLKTLQEQVDMLFLMTKVNLHRVRLHAVFDGLVRQDREQSESYGPF